MTSMTWNADEQIVDTSLQHDTNTSTLVLFDFDGTITTKDTLIEFVHFYRGKKNYWLGMLMLTPMLVLYALKIIPNWKAKQFFLAHYFKGESISNFTSRCLAFSTKVLPSLVRPGAVKAIQKYKSMNATIAVVSASAENWVKPWCDQNGILCLATRLEVSQNTITGKIKGRNCYGDEKVCRIKETFDLTKYNTIIAYGDSSGDKEMLELAQQRHYKPWRDK